MSIPTTKELAKNIFDQIVASMGITAPILPKAFIRVLSKAIAGVEIVLYKYSGFVLLQMFVNTASDKPTTINGRVIIPLNEWGSMVGIPERTKATQAELTIQVEVINKTGFLRTGSQLLGVGNGVVYLVAGDVALDDDFVYVVVRASGDQQNSNGSGTIGNLDIGAVLPFVNPLPNVKKNTIVVSQVVTGADKESTASYRTRILDRFQKRPQGGALADYEQWAEEAPGTLNAYPLTSDTPGQVDVYIESSTEPDGIPTQAQLEKALEFITYDNNGIANRAPAGALVNTFPISRVSFDVVITGITVPGDITPVHDQILLDLTKYFLNIEPFITGVTVGDRSDQVAETAIGGAVYSAVSSAGGYYEGVELFLDGSPMPLYFLGIGEKAKLGGIGYV